MKKNLLCKLSIAAIASIPLNLAGAQELAPVTAHTTDTLVNSDGTVRFDKHNFGRTGQWDSNSSVTGVLVLPFALPEVPEGESVSSAALAINLEGWRNLEVSLGDVDLYGLRVDKKPVVLESDFVNGELAPAADADAEGGLLEGSALIQEGFLPASEIDNFKMEVNTSSTTSEAGSAALGAWIQSLYAGGAKPGQFVFLALTIDNASQATDGSYYLFSTSEGDVPPTLTLVTGNPGGGETDAAEASGEAQSADEAAPAEADEDAPEAAEGNAAEPE